MRFDPTAHIVRDRTDAVSPADYAKSPPTAFLTHAVHLLDAVNHCERNFPKKPAKTTEFTKASSDSLHQLCTSTYGSLMSQFETFQHHLLAGLFEASRHVPEITTKSLEKQLKAEVPLSLVAAYRGAPAATGILLAESLGSWHDPERVNGYFKAFVNRDLFSNDAQRELQTLWQIRHTIVHTSGWLSASDSQKVEALRPFTGSAIVLGVPFIRATIQWLHRELKTSVEAYGVAFLARLPASVVAPERTVVEDLFKVESPRSSYFP